MVVDRLKISATAPVLHNATGGSVQLQPRLNHRLVVSLRLVPLVITV